MYNTLTKEVSRKALKMTKKRNDKMREVSRYSYVSKQIANKIAKSLGLPKQAQGAYLCNLENEARIRGIFYSEFKKELLAFGLYYGN